MKKKDEYDDEPIKKYYEREDNFYNSFSNEDYNQNTDIKNEYTDVWQEKNNNYNKNLDREEIEFAKKFAFYFILFFIILFIVSIFSAISVWITINKSIEEFENDNYETNIYTNYEEKM